VEGDPALLLREFLDDEDEAVRATALVGLVHTGWLQAEEGRRALDKLEKDATTAERVALARAIWHQPGEVFTPLLLRLARCESVELRYEVARAMDEVGSTDFLPALVEMLADRRLRAVARSALVRMGEPALEELDRALGDAATPLPVRRHLPRTISRFGGEEAAAILLGHLLEEGDGLTRYKILRGLNRLRADEPRLRLDPTVLARATEETIAGIARLLRWRVNLERGVRRDPERLTPTHELLVEMLSDKEERALERLFRLLGLQHSVDDMHSIYRGLRSRLDKVRSGSRELLEHLLRPPVREAVLALVDELPSAQRLSSLPGRGEGGPADYAATLGRLLDSGSESLACLAAYHAGELGLVQLEDRLLRLQEQGSPLLRGVVERSRALLRAPSKEGMRYG